MLRCSKHRLTQLEARASEMRAAPTASEARLFEAIRGGRLGVSFKRQVVLEGRFIADFYCAALKLAVEVDGGYHQERGAQDAKRDRALARAGHRVLRVDGALGLGEAVAAVAREVERLRRG